MISKRKVLRAHIADVEGRAGAVIVTGSENVGVAEPRADHTYTLCPCLFRENDRVR